MNREQSKHDQLKEEVVKRPHEYIRGCTMLITRTLAPSHEAIKCLLAFGSNTLKYTAEVLATIEWGTQHWKLQESFPVLPVPKWLCTPQMIQTMTPLRGELPLLPTGAHLRDIRVRSPAMWAWMAVLLQFWQDHIIQELFGGHLCQASDLANTLIHNINPWLPHSARFGWDYMAANATLWLDIQEQFTEEHFREWEAQRSPACQLSTLKHDTKIVYHRCLTKRQAKMEAAESREVVAKQLPPE